jgi:hypothetical protein
VNNTDPIKYRGELRYLRKVSSYVCLNLLSFHYSKYKKMYIICEETKFYYLTGASCSIFWTDTVLITKDNSYKVKANISNTAVISNKTVVKVTCINSSKRLDGPDIVRCINGSWDAKKPICVDGKYCTQE